MKTSYANQLSRQGMALIVVLFFLALLTIMVVGYLDVSRLDRGQSSTHLDRNMASVFAREGIERTVATLRRETVDPLRGEGESEANHQFRKRNWISQPGLLITAADPSEDPADLSVNQKQLRKRVELSSGIPGDGVTYEKPVFQPANLNVQLLTEQNHPGYLITNRPDNTGTQPPSMKLRWVYVRADSANSRQILDTSENPVLTNADQPLVGRYAWWVDDESTKLNYNLAWKRNPQNTLSGNTNPVSHPSTMNLMALTRPDGAYMPENMADALHTWTLTSPRRYFNSFADARQVEEITPGIVEFLAHNKFELTHYNHDPDTTFFGEERILLTTNRDLVPRNADGSYARRFIDIMRNDKPAASCDPGVLSDIAGGQEDWTNGGALLPNKFDAAVRMMIRYLSTKDWPIAPGVSFKDKYYPGSLDSDVRLAQIAANIIDYVRAKESAQPAIAPLRFGLDNNNYSLKFSAATSPTSLQGVGRSPLITEIGAFVEKDAVPRPSTAPAGWAVGTSLYPIHFRIEVHLPEKYHLPEGIDFATDVSPNPATASRGWFVGITELSNNQYYYLSPNNKLTRTSNRVDTLRILKSEITGGEGPNGTILKPGKYITITKTFYRTSNWAARSTLPTLRCGLYQNATSDAEQFITNINRHPRVCIFPQIVGMPVKMSDPATSSINQMISCQTDDPRCGVHPNDWTKDIPNTYGARNSTYRIGQTPYVAATLPQQDTDASGRLSDHSLYMPPPKGVGMNGPTGDNGRLTSIAEIGYISTGVNALTGSVSWRSIRLQPNRYADTNVLPDWLLMDLFSVPNTGTGLTGHLYHPHGTALGGRLNINAQVEPFTTMQRNRGLAALLLGANRVPSTENAETIATNIYNRVLSPSVNQTFGKAYGYPWGGVEANVYDTPGEVCEIAGVADDGEAGEDRVRSIASLITSRGGVFSIYTVGQSLKQGRNGTLTVTGEQRLHAMVERYLNNYGTQTEKDDQVQFRTIYLRHLTP